MSNYIDVKYLNMLSTQLGQFKRKNDKLWNFRCPYCGDSQKDKTKARGYVFSTDADLVYKCHNCGVGSGIGKLIKFVNPNMYKQYSLEKFKDKGHVKKTPKYQKTNTGDKFTTNIIPKFLRGDSPLKLLKTVSQLKIDHPVKKYVQARKIPNTYHRSLFYAPKFYKWVNECIPDKFDLDNLKDEPRLVIPFLDEDENMFGFQGRAFGKSQPRYITIMLDETAPKIFGLNKVDWNKPVVIVEGPIDSMFLDNAIAMAGADTSRFEAENVVYCWDNEPRNPEIVKRMSRAIEEEKSIVIFPNGIEEKDINDMVMGGMDVMEIQAIISNNTFKGLSAKAKLSEWRKV